MEDQTQQPLRQWSVHEYRHHERDRRWYFVAAGIMLVLLVLAVWSQNVFGAVGLLLLAVIMLVRSYVEPPRLDVAIFEQGILIGESFFPFRDLDNFWIAYEPPHVKMMYLEFQNRWRPRVPVPIEDEDPTELRELFLKYLDENTEREGEPLSDAISRWLKL